MTMLTNVPRSLLFFAFAVLTVGRAQAQTELVTITLPAPSLAAAIQRALERTEIRLHNLGPLREGSYHQALASSIKFRATEGPGKRTRFTLPDSSRTILGRRYGYYVDNVRASGVFVLPQPDRFTLTITLERPGGPALVGRCVRLRAPATACSALGEAQMPGIAWNGGRVDIDLLPVRFGSSLAFTATTVTIGGTFDVASACSYPVVGANICAGIDRATQRIRAKVAEQVKAALNDVAVKRDVAAAVREHLDTTAQIPILGVRRVEMVDGAVVLGLGLGR